MRPGITLRILSHNRKELLLQTLDSVFAQDEPFDHIELFDNGSDFPLKELLSRYPALRIFGLPGAVSQAENARRAFAQVTPTPWICVFHDDDLMHPDFCRKTRDAILNHPEATALSCNGEVIDEGGNPQGSLVPGLVKDQYFNGPTDLARWYCDAFIPFPPTVYWWSAAFGADLDFAEPYGRCADVALLSRVVARGPILLLAERNFSYRRHGGQDSAGFKWWEETKRWELQIQLCSEDPGDRCYVRKKRNARMTSRWLNTWLQAKPREEDWDWQFFSLVSAHRFFRNNKLRILLRLMKAGAKP
jgi:glycosyltransferase involved in cell wall biosynthesis